MSGLDYQRSVEALHDLASMFWPSELSEKEAKLSVIPKLLETQDQFIAILSVDVNSLEGLFRIVDSSTFPANLFLKHLVVLSDFSGEMLQRVNNQFLTLFPTGRLEYLQNGQQHTYCFKSLPVRGSLNNAKLGISGKKLSREYPLNELFQDVIALLVFGSACVNEDAANVLAKCEIGNYLGQPGELEKFIKQRYIWVSRITGGAQANALGQIAQNFVERHLQDNLQVEGVEIRQSGHLPGVSHTEPQTDRPTTFDLVVAKDNKYVAVEISFQVTTNSTIERKAGQAKARFEQIEQAGHKIAYVIDGAGNFQRENAIRTLCSFSHCTVAFSQSELDLLCEFLRSHLTTSITR